MKDCACCPCLSSRALNHFVRSGSGLLIGLNTKIVRKSFWHSKFDLASELNAIFKICVRLNSVILTKLVNTHPFDFPAKGAVFVCPPPIGGRRLLVFQAHSRVPRSAPPPRSRLPAPARSLPSPLTPPRVRESCPDSRASGIEPFRILGPVPREPRVVRQAQSENSLRGNQECARVAPLTSGAGGGGFRDQVAKGG